jgi:hypothetical protein
LKRLQPPEIPHHQRHDDRPPVRGDRDRRAAGEIDLPAATLLRVLRRQGLDPTSRMASI